MNHELKRISVIFYYIILYYITAIIIPLCLFPFVLTELSFPSQTKQTKGRRERLMKKWRTKGKT